MKTIQMLLPYPPSVNHYWKKYRNRMVISDSGRRYRKMVQCIIEDMNAKNAFKESDKIRATLLVYPPDKRRRDIDNIPKAVFDALGSNGLYPDDSQIHDLRIRKMEVDKNGSIYARFTRI